MTLPDITYSHVCRATRPSVTPREQWHPLVEGWHVPLDLSPSTHGSIIYCNCGYQFHYNSYHWYWWLIHAVPIEWRMLYNQNPVEWLDYSTLMYIRAIQIIHVKSLLSPRKSAPWESASGAKNSSSSGTSRRDNDKWTLMSKLSGIFRGCPAAETTFNRPYIYFFLVFSRIVVKNWISDNRVSCWEGNW